MRDILKDLNLLDPNHFCIGIEHWTNNLKKTIEIFHLKHIKLENVAILVSDRERKQTLSLYRAKKRDKCNAIEVLPISANFSFVILL